MTNGKPGDHPVNDILDHDAAVFSAEADTLVREIAKLMPRYRLWDLVDWLAPPPLDEFTAHLRKIRNDLREQARVNGWEV